MLEYQKKFIQFAIAQGALKFGEFTLKSGRISPYFFNMGNLSSGKSIHSLAQAYAIALWADAIDAPASEQTSDVHPMHFDVLFGPAYKGIPLVSATAMALYEKFRADVPYAFNRKEAKDHGEGGTLVGADLRGKRVMVIDDVITAGTAIREVVSLLDAQDAKLAGVVIALDRQERGTGDRSAIQQVQDDYGIQVRSIIKLENILDYLIEAPCKLEEDTFRIASIESYRNQYGVR